MEIRSRILDFLVPPRCQLCGAAGVGGLDLCSDCTRSLPVIRHACVRCALPLAVDADNLYCGDCLGRDRPFDRANSVLSWRDSTIDLVTRLKYGGKLPVAGLVGELLLRKVVQDAASVDALLPVPLHVSRLRDRGFNQSVEIARVINRALHKPLLLDEIARVRDTPHQSGLDARRRKINIRGAFAVTAPLAAGHVAIIDDVVTTASTVGELARVLKRAGVNEVSVWSVARAEK